MIIKSLVRFATATARNLKGKLSTHEDQIWLSARKKAKWRRKKKCCYGYERGGEDHEIWPWMMIMMLCIGETEKICCSLYQAHAKHLKRITHLHLQMSA